MTILSKSNRIATVKFRDPGDKVAGVIMDLKDAPQTDFETKQPTFWPDGEEKMQVICTLDTTEGKRKLYIKSGILTAIRAALASQDGVDDLEVNGTLSVEFVMTGPKNSKVYRADYVPPEV